MLQRVCMVSILFLCTVAKDHRGQKLLHLQLRGEQAHANAADLVPVLYASVPRAEVPSAEATPHPLWLGRPPSLRDQICRRQTCCETRPSDLAL